MSVTTTAPALPAWAGPGRYPFFPSRPTPVRAASGGMTLEVTTNRHGDLRVRHLGGFVTVAGVDHHLAGDLSVNFEGSLNYGAYNTLAQCAAGGAPAGGGCCAEAQPQLTGALDDLMAACAAVGLSGRACRYGYARYDRGWLAWCPQWLREGCACSAGAALVGPGVGHWGCADWDAELSQSRWHALALVPYHYPEGSPERTAAVALAGTLLCDPDELRAVIAALHTAPQRPRSQP